MKGRDFLLVAEQVVVLIPNEAGYRTAVGRAYYAAFLEMRDLGERLGELERMKSAREHGEVGRLAARRLPDAASQLKFLRAFRNEADYDLAMDLTTLRDRAFGCISACRQVIEAIDGEIDRLAAFESVDNPKPET